MCTKINDKTVSDKDNTVFVTNTLVLQVTFYLL
jgi:hypothetical protein